MVVEHFSNLLVGNIVNCWLAHFFPLFLTESISNCWIQIFTLHNAKCLFCAKVVTRTANALRAHCFNRQRLVGDLDSLDGALHRTNGVVIKNNTLELIAEEAAVHASSFIDQVHAGVANQCMVDALFRTRLRVWVFRIGDT